MGLPMFLEPACWADRLISWPCWRMILDSTFPRHIKEHLNSTRMGFIDLGLVTFWTVTPKSVVVTSHYEDLQNHGLHGLHVLMPIRHQSRKCLQIHQWRRGRSRGLLRIGRESGHVHGVQLPAGRNCWEKRALPSRKPYWGLFSKHLSPTATQTKTRILNNS